MRTLVGGVVIVAVCVPVSVVLTIVLLPLWRWIEKVFGLESIGHSGPAEWCYVATFLACVLLLLCAYTFTGNRRRS
jgi:hypothetical protein